MMGESTHDRYEEQLRAENETLRKRNDELVVELMQQSANASEAREEARRLREAIVTHRDQTGHNMCWLNDRKLWGALGDGSSPTLAEMAIPPKEEFLTGCRAYYASRFSGTPEGPHPV
ncbi:hypothetical protein HY629_01050 [Candidatus Uhrbacteria bacterium]|nr:hypothetical protein [Candidatus Uhrbacteria bacterium]